MVEISQNNEIKKRKYKKYLKNNKANFLEYWAKRKGKGYIPLNEYFEDSDGHHIDHEHVIYIPIFIHRYIPHHHKDPESMWVINAMALIWLLYGTIPEIDMKLPKWIFYDNRNNGKYINVNKPKKNSQLKL